MFVSVLETPAHYRNFKYKYKEEKTMKIMENCIMIHVYFQRNTITGDSKAIDIAVEECPSYFESEVYYQWIEDLHKTIEARYNSYHYWDEIKITREVFFRGEMHIVEL